MMQDDVRRKRNTANNVSIWVFFSRYRSPLNLDAMLPTLGGAARHIFCDTKVTRDPASGLRPFHDQTIWNTIWNTMWNTMRYHEHVWAWADPRSYGDQVRLIRVNGSLHTMRPNLPKFPWTSLQMGGTCVSWAVCLRCLSWCSPAAHGDARSQLVVACAPPAADLAGPIRSSQPGTSQHRSIATSDIIKCTRQKICGYYVDQSGPICRSMIYKLYVYVSNMDQPRHISPDGNADILLSHIFF